VGYPLPSRWAGLGVGGFASQDFGHDVSGLVAGERGAVIGDLVQRVEDHEEVTGN
jgi:hypothetical protein